MQIRSLWLVLALAGTATAALAQVPPPTPADAQWRLADPPAPADNVGTPARVALGKTLFFEPLLSGNGALSCATCHNPSLGWADGLKTAHGIKGPMNRASPSIVNAAYHTLFNWDGRRVSLEDQALGPMQNAANMGADLKVVMERLRAVPRYAAMFAEAYPGEPMNEQTLVKALGAFQRTVLTRDSAFDRWLEGDTGALTPSQWRGFQVFKDPARGNCAVCHAAPAFTDNAFHNIGLRPSVPPDVGRYAVRPVAAMRGAFKTPTLRDIERTAPYFRDGSAATLREVIAHYERGGEDITNLSPDLKPLTLSAQDKVDLEAFLRALTGRPRPVTLPELPR